MNKVDFTRVVNEGIARNKKFLVVKMETEGNPGVELIVNPSENFEQKLKYYDKAYNDNMELIGKPGTPGEGKLIRIIDALMTSNLNDLTWFVY